MRQKVLSILALLLMAVTGAMAEPITVTWTSSNGSFDNRVQYSGDGPFYSESSQEWVLYEEGTFTTNLGNFTQIQISGGYVDNYGAPGWNDRTWTGNASSVYMNAFVTSDHGNNNFTITFTIEPPTVAVTGITLDKTSAEMTVGGDALTLTATVAPANATNKTVTWTSSDESVATVANGVVTAVAAGTATITATATNGTADTSDDFSATCTVTVTDPATKYNLTLADGSDDHGTVAFTVGGNAATEAKKDDVVTVSVTPATGYSAKDVTVKAYTSMEVAGARGMKREAPGVLKDITVTKQTDGTWQFTMPEADVEVEVTYTKNLQDSWIEDIDDQTYTGEDITPTVTVKDGSSVLTAGTHYTVAYSSNKEVGTATVTITAVAGSDYSGTASKTFTIEKANITMTTAPAAVSGLAYTGGEQTLITGGVASFGTVLYSLDGENFSAALPQGTNAGTYTVTYKVEGDDNHNAFAAQTLNVTIATNKTELNDAITEAEEYHSSISESNPDAAAALQTAINAAKQVKDNADATQTEIETATETLTDALNAAKTEVALKRVTLTIPAKSYATRIDADKRQIETAVTGVNLYTVTSVTDKQVVLSNELSVVAAKKPFLIYNDNDEAKTVSIVVSSNAADNVTVATEFKGTLTAKTFTADDMQAADHYVLNGKNFVWVKNAGTLAAGKCWIELAKSAGASRLSIVFGESTGIAGVSVEGAEHTGWYDLSGRRVAKPAKGVYVKDGKKVVVK